MRNRSEDLSDSAGYREQHRREAARPIVLFENPPLHVKQEVHE